MRRFRFRLETVLRLRQREEERAQIAFAQARRRLAAEQAQLRALETDAHLHTELHARRRAAGAEPAEVLRLDDYAQALAQAIWRQEQVVAEAGEEVERRREQLHDAIRRREVLTRLRERRRREHLAAALAEEQKALDDFAVIRYAAADKEAARHA